MIECDGDVGISNTRADRLRFLEYADSVRLTIFFFFQAEDGIRDLTVTGVQTCALPISPQPRPAARSRGSSSAQAYTKKRRSRGDRLPARHYARIPNPESRASSGGRQIGRASCRERV